VNSGAALTLQNLVIADGAPVSYPEVSTTWGRRRSITSPSLNHGSDGGAIFNPTAPRRRSAAAFFRQPRPTLAAPSVSAAMITNSTFTASSADSGRRDHQLWRHNDRQRQFDLLPIAAAFGGLFNNGSTVTVKGSTISANTATPAPGSTTAAVAL
jgi:hypothetical protein